MRCETGFSVPDEEWCSFCQFKDCMYWEIYNKEVVNESE